MTTTLIKTNNSLILVSEKEQVTLGKLYYESDNNIPIYSFTKETLPDEYYLNPVLSQSPKLSKEVADEIGWIDVEELTDVSIYKWLESKKYQTEYEETGEYKMYFSVDMPKILNDFIKDFGFQKAQELNQKNLIYSELLWNEFIKSDINNGSASSYHEFLKHKSKSINQYNCEMEYQPDGTILVTKLI